MQLYLFFALHWIHVLSSVIWLGTLYFFNFYLTAFLEKARPEARVEVFGKLVPLAMHGFNWSTFATVLSGWLLYFHSLNTVGIAAFFNWPYGLAISLGGLLGTAMFLNGWFIMHPKQERVVASAIRVAKGEEPDPEAPLLSRHVVLTSRVNLLLSIPMLFLMVAATHDPPMFLMTDAHAPIWFWIIVLAIVGAVEIVPILGPRGGFKRGIETLSGALTAGFVLLAVFYILIRTVL
ncbi:MAG: urate hydroxylase PuuD [Deltaproteobacteria bacterium]